MTKEQVKGLRTRITKDVDQLFHHIAGLDMACDEAIDWGKMAEIDMRKAQEQSRADRAALEALAQTEARQAERERIVEKLTILGKVAKEAGERHGDSDMGNVYRGQAVGYRLAIIAIEEPTP